VIDTLRADAVSAYGQVEGTTPILDRLAAEGAVYTQAFAPSSWTLPSHATLLTGLGVEHHGVGAQGRTKLSEAVVTLAERFAAAGYSTGGISENLLVSPPFGLAQGFRFYQADGGALDREGRGSFDVLEKVDLWLDRAAEPPFFLFINLADAHDPYEVRDDNPFLPEGTSLAEARGIQIGGKPGIAASAGICDRLPGPRELEILRGLYLGDVHAADGKLGRILEKLRAAGHDPITVVTSDHGEHLGEHHLLGHEFTVRNVALRVPLILRGAPGLEPGRVDEPVTLADVSASLLDLAGIAAPPDSAGRPLPGPGASPPAPRSLIAMYEDVPLALPDDLGAHVAEGSTGERRKGCGPEHQVFGSLFSLLRSPYKLIESPNHPTQLYDIRWDPDELSDIASHHPETVAELSSELHGFRTRIGELEALPMDAEAAERLRALGYAD
jgi:arylsulfatase A-like enzyme